MQRARESRQFRFAARLVVVSAVALHAATALVEARIVVIAP